MPGLPGDTTSPVPVASRFEEHRLRGFALNEIHARPFPVMTTPRLVLHYAFMTDVAGAEHAREDLARRCAAAGVPGPGPGANHHVLEAAGRRLRWETHTEFSTYTWDLDPPDFEFADPALEMFGADFKPPGTLMVAMRLDLVTDPRPTDTLLGHLDPGSMAVSTLRDGRAIAATDFRPDAGGMTRILVINRGLYPREIGPLVQRLVELETYRTLALLGLPEARRQEPEVVRIEKALGICTQRIGHTPTLNANKALLDDLTTLAAELEASAAASAYRFGATRAYAEIVRLRLSSIREGVVEGYSRLSSFLERRMAPAMRTCQNLEQRQLDLAHRLERAATLLRTRIDVELEQQNRELLAAMNTRAKMQFRLQQWVEGLSVAAVSYYVVGLISYIAKGAEGTEMEHIRPEWVTAAAVIPVVVLIWLFVRRIRAREGHEPEES